jgi:hypothetical protein
MNFVGIGTVPPVFILLMLVAVVAFYSLYLWSLSRLITKAGFPRKYVAIAACFDIALAFLGLGPWLWYRLFHPPIPISAFAAIMALAFSRWPTIDPPTERADLAT